MSVLCGCLSGCVTTRSDEMTWPATCGADLGPWIAFVDHVDGLEGDALTAEYTSTLQRFLARPGDVERLRLSYLLSQPLLPMRNVERSGILLQEIDPAGACAPYAALSRRMLASMQDLESAQEALRKLKSQLETLKGIDADITDGQEEFEELTP